MFKRIIFTLKNKMIKLKKFVFNNFQENTYIIYDETNECVIIDPGCNSKMEDDIILSYINSNNLKPVELLNTHCHLDHIFGNYLFQKEYSLIPKFHKLDLPLYINQKNIADSYGIKFNIPNYNSLHIDENDKIYFGNNFLNILFTPGHSPGHLCFLNKQENILISGDLIFQLSVGRTDLPLGDFEDLMKSINNKIINLNDNMKIYPGHGNNSNIGFEKKHNPFIQDNTDITNQND